MRSYVPDFELVVAGDLAGALDYLARGFQPFAGGTDLMVLFNAGKLTPVPLVSIRKLGDLRAIKLQTGCIEIGAAVTYSEIRHHAAICAEFPLLSQSASWTGSIANQNRGTLGGNIANASPAADSSPVLLVYDAELKLVSKSGERWVPYSSFHLGYKKMALEKGELIASIRLPRTGSVTTQYGRKVGTRKAMAISKISFAAIAQSGTFRVAAGSVAPIPVRCINTERFLANQKLTPAVIEQAKLVIGQDISPITDLRSTGDYRLAVTQNLLGEFLEMLL
jgi:CO/xanthine dehydrogenase FAD-binding subunit